MLWPLTSTTKMKLSTVQLIFSVYRETLVILQLKLKIKCSSSVIQFLWKGILPSFLRISAICADIFITNCTSPFGFSFAGGKRCGQKGVGSDSSSNTQLPAAASLQVKYCADWLQLNSSLWNVCVYLSFTDCTIGLGILSCLWVIISESHKDSIHLHSERFSASDVGGKSFMGRALLREQTPF